MQQRQWWLVLVLLGAAAGMPERLASAANADEPTSPRVAGRTLSQWSAQLQSSNRTVRLRAVFSLGAFGSPAVPSLTGALANTDPAVRYQAASQLGDIGLPAQSARPELKRLLAGKNFAVRLSAGYALCRLGDVPAGLPTLIKGLTVADRGTNISTADFLARIGPPAQAAVPALKNALAKEQRQKRRSPILAGQAIEEALRKITGEPTP